MAAEELPQAVSRYEVLLTESDVRNRPSFERRVDGIAPDRQVIYEVLRRENLWQFLETSRLLRG